jgi:hypothetical protein
MSAAAEYSITHSGMQELIALSLKGTGYETSIEHALPNGRRADIYARKQSHVLIIEIKTLFRNSLLAEAYGKYHEHCDYLVYASPETDMADYRPPSVLIWSDAKLDRIGLWRMRDGRITVRRNPTRLR